MNRRRCLKVSGLTVSGSLAGCLGPEDSTDEAPDREIALIDRFDQPGSDIEYDVTVAERTATVDHPARLTISIRNRSTEQRVLGEERAVQFHHVASEDWGLYCYPGSAELPASVTGPCWRLQDPVAIPEYYGTLTVAPSSTIRSEVRVLGHYALGVDTCLPTGEIPVRTEGVVGLTADAVLQDEGQSVEWGFTVSVSEIAE